MQWMQNVRRATTEKTLQYYESKEIAQSYSRYRPAHPTQLLERIFAFQQKHGVGTEVALDLCCGAGQSTFGLCSRFRRTIGVDISAEQITYAAEKASALGLVGTGDYNVELVVAPASKLPVDDESVDLMTCAVAWHWLDPDTVFSEIDRVLKRPAVLAVYSYWLPVLHQQDCNNLFEQFIHHSTIWQDGPQGNVKVINANHYRDVKMPYPIAERYEMMDPSVTTLEDLLGFSRSLDAYHTYCEQNPGNTALEDMVEKMRRVLIAEQGMAHVDAASTPLGQDRPYFLLLAVKL